MKYISCTHWGSSLRSGAIFFVGAIFMAGIVDQQAMVNIDNFTVLSYKKFQQNPKFA